jgi:hypothetical protein
MKALVVVAILAVAAPAQAYLHFSVQSGNRVIPLKWPQSMVRYFVSNRPVPGVSVPQFQAAIARAFDTWQAVPEATISFEFVGVTSALPVDDGLTTLGFLERRDLQNVLGATSFTFDILTGEIVEADIFFNSSMAWSVSDAGETGRFDLQSIAVHEIGHLVGLGHSALGETEMTSTGRRVLGAEAVMFPIAFAPGPGRLAGRTLKADDIAGVADLYPDAQFRNRTGSIQGVVTLNGRGVFGAHVVAFSLRTAQLVGAFALNSSGQFLISGLEPGAYVLRVEPLDDAAIDSFFEEGPPPEVNFRTAFSPLAAIVPAGGTTPSMTVTVPPK